MTKKTIFYLIVLQQRRNGVGGILGTKAVLCKLAGRATHEKIREK